MRLLEKLIKQLMILKKQLAKKRRAIIALASVVVFFMTYVMILPATSMGTEPVQAETNIETSQETGKSGEQGSNVVVDNASVGESQAAEATVDEAANDNATPTEGNEGDNGPLDISNYITSATAQYSTDNGGTWVDITTTTKIPVTARIKIKAKYAEVPALDLVNKHDRQLVYTLPSLLLDPHVEGGTMLDENNNVIGSIAADTEKKTVTITFDESYLRNENLGRRIGGEFSFYASADTNTVKQNPNQTTKVGKTDITLNFDPDTVIRLKDLRLEKARAEYSTDDSGVGYLTYKLKVTTGDEAVDNVKVMDSFTNGADYIDKDSYVFDKKPEGQTVVVDKGIMTWTIGNMGAHETQELTYKVRMKNTYYGMQPKGAVTNTATPYSGNVDFNTVSSTFTPTANASIQKNAGNIQGLDDDKSTTITIPYTITVAAPNTNTWTLRNLKIADNLGSMNASDRTILLQNRNLQFSDFHIYKGSTIDTSKEEEIATDKLITHYETGNTSNPRYDLYIGDLEPGATKTITYNIVIKKDVFASKNGGNWNIHNNAGLYSDDKTVGGNVSFGTSSASKNFGNKQWVRKLMGDKTSDEVRETASEFYTYSNGKWSADPNTKKSYTVPTGSYRYQVVVNEDGKWNVSSSTFNDVISNNRYLKYNGFLKIEYFAQGLESTPKSDVEAARALESKTADQTWYLDINQKDSFNLKPSDIGGAGAGAYLLTYYASPVQGNYANVTASNSFEIRGGVIGPGGGSVNISGINVKTNVSFEGESDLRAHKYGWYYDHTDKSNPFTNGRLYWVIDISGTSVPAGIQFKDTPVTDGNNANDLTDSSLVGVYRGSVPGGASFTDYYASINDFHQSSDFVALQKENDYTWSRSGGDGILTINKSVELEGEHLYAILMTNPRRSFGQRDYRAFQNKLFMKEVGSDNFADQNTAQVSAVGEGSNYKEAAGVYTRDEKGNWATLKEIMRGNQPNTKVISNAVDNKSGIYIDWRLIVNYAGDLSGTVHVSDYLPEGTELAYARILWYGSSVKTGDSRPATSQISELDGSSEWEDKGLKNVANDNGSTSSMYCYYNKDTREIRYDISNLKNLGGADTSDLQVQILVRVTDSDTLMGTANDVNFNNRMVVKNEQGFDISSSNSTVGFKTKSITKTRQTIDAGRVPFTIVVNPLGTDLVPGTDKITLVDDMDSPLSFDPTSIKITDVDGKDVTGAVTIAISDTSTGQQLRLQLPDSRKLTVTYNATVNQRPGTKIASLQNRVYWEGHSESTSSITEKDVNYNVSATAYTSDPPQFKVMKVDAEDINTKLQGAEFKLQKAKMDADGRRLVLTDHHPTKWGSEEGADPIYTATTGKDGSLTFPNSDLKYNTVYCLWEEKAPQGYVKDDTVYYIAVAQTDKETGKYPAEIEGLESNGVQVVYSGTTFNFTAYNRKEKGEIVVNKFFKLGDIPLVNVPDGTYSFGLYAGEDATWSQKLNITYKDGMRSCSISRLENGKEVSSAVDKDNPKFTGLDLGTTYSIYELNSDGNRITEGGIKYLDGMHGFRVSYSGNSGISFADKKEATVDVTNTVANIKLVLKKTDTNGKALTGAEFLLQKHNTSTGWENVTAGGLSDGKITVNSEDGFDITELTAGTYKIVETKAPDGYIIASAGEMMLTVTNSDISMDTSKLGGMVQFSKPTNGEITYTITVKNQAGTALPDTGGSGTMLFYILGVALAVGAGVIFLLRRRSV